MRLSQGVQDAQLAEHRPPKRRRRSAGAAGDAAVGIMLDAASDIRSVNARCEHASPAPALAEQTDKNLDVTNQSGQVRWRLQGLAVTTCPQQCPRVMLAGPRSFALLRG